MAIRKTEAQRRQRRNRLKLMVVGGASAGVLVVGGVGASAIAALSGPGQVSAPGADGQVAAAGMTERVDATGGDAFIEAELGRATPGWTFEVHTLEGLTSVQVNVSNVSVPVEVTVDGQRLPVRNGEGVTSTRSEGLVVVEVALVDSAEESPFRVRVDGPDPVED